eukprot:9478770-Pyramimonas_sp.AAC.1
MGLEGFRHTPLDNARVCTSFRFLQRLLATARAQRRSTDFDVRAREARLVTFYENLEKSFGFLKISQELA